MNAKCSSILNLYSCRARNPNFSFFYSGPKQLKYGNVLRSNAYLNRNETFKFIFHVFMSLRAVTIDAEIDIV